MTTWEGIGSAIRLVTLGSALLLSSWCVAPEAQAASTFTAHSIGLFQAGGVDQDTATAATPVTVTSTVSNSNGQLEATSITERGFLSLSGFVSASNARGTSGTLGTFIDVQDLKIRRIDGTPSTENVAATFQYFSSYNAAWSGTPPPVAGLSASDFTILAQITQGATSFSETDIYKKDYVGPSTGSPGLESIAGTLQADVPFALRLSIFSGGLSATRGNFGQYDFSLNIGPAAFAPSPAGALSGSSSNSGPVFLLPAGFTVDSPELNLLDNQWQVVPEPSSLVLLLSLGLLAVRRTR